MNRQIDRPGITMQDCARMNLPPLFLVDDVACAFGVSRSRVIALDAKLNPIRTPGGVRIYSRDVVDYWTGHRLVRAS